MCAKDQQRGSGQSSGSRQSWALKGRCSGLSAAAAPVPDDVGGTVARAVPHVVEHPHDLVVVRVAVVGKSPPEARQQAGVGEQRVVHLTLGVVEVRVWAAADGPGSQLVLAEQRGREGRGLHGQTLPAV